MECSRALGASGADALLQTLLTKTPPGAAGVPPVNRPTPRSLSMLFNSVSVMLGKAATMGLGFLFWLLAARQFAPEQVGLAAGAVSAMMLSTQLAILGFGSAVITDLPRHLDRPARLLNTSFTVVAAVALGVAGGFVLLASSVLTELNVVASNPVFILLFLATTLLGTLGILFDQVSIALRRGDQVLVRGFLFGGLTVGLIVLLPLVSDAQSSVAIFAPWVVAGLGICLVGSIQLWRSLHGYRYRPRADRRMAGRLLRVGLPNYALTLTERAPGLILPIVVTELLSPTANATWYAVWMMAWVVYIIPISVGLALFAEAAHRPETLRASVVSGIRSALAIGLAAALALGLSAHFALSLLGPGYADAGETPLRILLGAFVPLAFVQAYFAACRARQCLREAIVTGVVSGSIAVGAAAAAGVVFGLNGMALAWVVVQALTGVWAVLRLRSLDGRKRALHPERPEPRQAFQRVPERPAET